MMENQDSAEKTMNVEDTAKLLVNLFLEFIGPSNSEEAQATLKMRNQTLINVAKAGLDLEQVNIRFQEMLDADARYQIIQEILANE